MAILLVEQEKIIILNLEAGLYQGRRNELTGGGLIRSLGGWTEVKKYGLKGQDHIKSDERILGESDFVTDILSKADEKFEHKYELKRLGYDLDRIAARVAEIYGIEVDEIFLKGKQQKRVKARSLFCLAPHENLCWHFGSWSFPSPWIKANEDVVSVRYPRAR